MKARHKILAPFYMNHLQNALQVVSHFEDTLPLSSYGEAFPEWEAAFKEHLSTLDLDYTPEVQSLLRLRKAAHAAAFSQQNQAIGAAEASWKWLLDHPQIPQRTKEWYLEKQEILTASEIGKLWQGNAAKSGLIQSKARPIQLSESPQRLATLRSQTTPFGWGIRYEPVAKLVLEERGPSTIQDLGRIRHRTVPRLAASPDGLFISGPFVGRLVEIKCPISRQIKDNEIPKEYWQQIQIQLEVCDLDLCEYVEVKLKQLEADDPGVKGWITLWLNNETLDTEYEYHSRPEHRQRNGPGEEAWQPMETYGWAVETLRQVTVARDRAWFESIQPILAEFWQTVEAARRGEWQPPPVRQVRKKTAKVEGEGRCAIQDQESESTLLSPSPSAAPPEETEPSVMPPPTSYIESGTSETVVLNP